MAINTGTDEKGEKFAELEFGPKEKKPNPFLNYFRNIKNVKNNYKKVRGSPFASLKLALTFRKIIIGILIAFMTYQGYFMVKNIHTSGLMGIIQGVFTIGLLAYICWISYKTIPQAKRQLEYYRRNPHVINYAPTDAKETVDDILSKIRENSKKLKGGEKNGIRKKTSGSTSSKEAGSASPSSSGS